MDHGITLGAIKGLQNIESTIDAVTRGGADSVLTQRGLADRVHPNKNGKGYVIHLNASTTMGPDANNKRTTGTVREAVRAGADAVSLHVNVGSNHEPHQLEDLAAVTKEAREYGMPVLAMAYPRGPEVDEHDKTNLAHAVRIAEEMDAGIAKTAYPGAAETYDTVIDAVDIPAIMAGGAPQTDRQMV